MTTGSQLKALLKSFEVGDEERLYSIGLQMAALETPLDHNGVRNGVCAMGPHLHMSSVADATRSSCERTY